MDGSSKKASGKSKRKTQQEDEAEMIDTSSNQEFVDKMKKRATVTTHGIDNVRDYGV
jgi:flagellum-specific peptidoglycan hydrolase FlgJ